MQQMMATARDIGEKKISPGSSMDVSINHIERYGNELIVHWNVATGTEDPMDIVFDVTIAAPHDDRVNSRRDSNNVPNVVGSHSGTSHFTFHLEEDDDPAEVLVTAMTVEPEVDSVQTWTEVPPPGDDDHEDRDDEIPILPIVAGMAGVGVVGLAYLLVRYF